MRWVVTMVASSVLLGCGRGAIIEGAEGSGSGSGAEGSGSGSGADGSSTIADDCMPTSDTEQCDGVDNDCDGQIDEDIAPVVCGIGHCQATVSCEAGVMPPCVPQEPAPEVCNLDDDDCDGEVDEGFGFGPLGEPIVLRSNEFATGSCTSCSWAVGTALAPVDGGWLSLWNLGIYGGNEQPPLYGRFVDAAGVPTGPVELLLDDIFVDMYPVQALAPMPALGMPLAVEYRAPGQQDVSGLLFVGVDGSASLAQPIPGAGPSNVERTVWTGERFVTTWEEDDALRVAVLGADGSLDHMVEVDPLERPARVTLGVYPGRVGLMVSRVRVDLELWDQWFILLDSLGQVVVPAHEVDVEYESWQRVVGTEQGWLHIRPNGFGEPSTRQTLDVEGNPTSEALPFFDGRHLDDSGLTDTFVPRPGLGEILTAWGDGDGIMHVELLDDAGELRRGWSGPLEVDPGYEGGYLVDPHAQVVGDRVLVIWHGLAQDEQPNRVLMRSFGCVP